MSTVLLLPHSCNRCRDPACDALCVRVADEDNSYDSDDLGVSVLGLAGLAENPHHEHKFKLPLRGKAADETGARVKRAMK